MENNPKEAEKYTKMAYNLNMLAIIGGIFLWFGVYQYCSYYSIENKAKRNAEELKLTMKNAFGDAEGFPGAMFNGIKPPEIPKVLTETEIKNKVNEIRAKYYNDEYRKMGAKSTSLLKEDDRLQEKRKEFDYESEEYQKIKKEIDKNLEERQEITAKRKEIDRKRNQEIMTFYEQQGKVQPLPPLPDWF
jgi:hypothetical protein